MSATVHASIVDEIAALGRELNANQYRVVRLAARYEGSLEWFRDGFKSAASAIAEMVDIHSSTAREWIRVGHSLDELPLIHDAFAENDLSYAKTRILTRWADPENEAELLSLARDRTANRLTTAIANHLAGDETDADRDQRHHDNRSVTVHTDAEGMVIIRAALPPSIGKAVAAALNTVMQQVAATPIDDPADCGGASADARRTETGNPCDGPDASADAPDTATMAEQLRVLKRQWQPTDHDVRWIPSLDQQRADAFALLFLDKSIDVVTEIVIHVRGDGTTFDDGTPVTNNAVCQRLDQSFIRMMIHDSERRPLNASTRRRHPTTRQKRIVLEAHNHECVDCQDTELLELDHNPPWHQTQRTVTNELEPRCAPCHRARHRV